MNTSSMQTNYFRSVNGAEHLSFESLEEALKGAATAPPMKTGKDFSLTNHEVTPFGTTKSSRPHIAGYAGYVPKIRIDTDRIPSAVGRNPWPGTNPVQMGMDKMRAFRSVQGYTGHVPSLHSPLRGGKGMTSQTNLNILRALQSVLESGVDVGVIARCLDKSKSGWLDAEKIFDGMRQLGFRMVTTDDIHILFDQFKGDIDQGQLPTSVLLSAVTERDWSFTSEPVTGTGKAASPPNAEEHMSFESQMGFSSLPRTLIGDGVVKSRAGAASAPPYVSPYEPKVFQDYRFPLREDYFQIKQRNLFSRGRIPGYTGYIPLVRPQNRTLGRDVVGKSFSRQSRIVKNHMDSGFPALSPPGRSAESMTVTTEYLSPSAPQRTSPKANTTICGMISEPGPAITPTVKARSSAMRLKASQGPGSRTVTSASPLIFNMS